MANSRDILKRLKAVGNIRRITRTMQMIATSKFSRAQQRSLSSKPYTEALLDLVGELAGLDGADHPLLSGVETARDNPELTLVITSDRGLCGPYNGTIVRTALAHFREHQTASDGTIEVVGKKGAISLRFNGFAVATQHTQFGDKPTFEDVDRLASSYIDQYLAGEVSAIRVIAMRYISAGKQVPMVHQLLPFSPATTDRADDETAGASPLFEFSPSERDLLGKIVPAAVKALLFQAFNDAIVSEHIARMVAMKAATDNAQEMIKLLTRSYNRARQSQITTELNEIISGAAALE